MHQVFGIHHSPQIKDQVIVKAVLTIATIAVTVGSMPYSGAAGAAKTHGRITQAPLHKPNTPQASARQVYVEDFAVDLALDTAHQTEWDTNDETLHLAPHRPIQQAHPAAAADKAGHVIIVWQDTRRDAQNEAGGETSDIYAQRITRTGQRLWLRDVRVNAASLSPQATHPALSLSTLSNDGWMWVVWQEVRDGISDIYAQCLDSNGNRRWPTDIRVSASAADVPRFGPAIAWQSGGPMVAWVAGESVYAQRLSDAGSPLWANDVLVSDQARAAANVRIATDGSAFWVAWSHVSLGGLSRLSELSELSGLDAGLSAGPETTTNKTSFGEINLLAQRLAADGQKLWPAPKAINASAMVQIQTEAPAVALNALGDATFAWANAVLTTTNALQVGIFAQRRDDAGQPAWVSDTLASGPVSSVVTYASPAIMLSGALTPIAWAETQPAQQPNRWAIVGQALNAAGQRTSLSNTQISHLAFLTTGITPSLNLAALNAAEGLLAWSGSVSPTANLSPTLNSNVYAQHISTTLAPGWNTDLLVPLADTAYFVTGTVTSGPVDVVTETIRSAVLSSQHARHGGDVRFYLSNNGGANWVTTTPGVLVTFTVAGSDLRWRAELQASDDRAQSPIVDTVRIEYDAGSTPLPALADGYETDDTCDAAWTLSQHADGQLHNFHRNADADWVRLDVVAGATYVVEARALELNANLVLALHPNCTEAALMTQTNAFSPDARMIWQATYTGTAYLQATNQPAEAYGERTAYTLQVRRAQQPGVQPLAVIVAGGLLPTDTLRANVSYAADEAYRAFVAMGLPKQRIRYLSSLGNHDADGNDLSDDVSGQATSANIRDAIQTWLGNMGARKGVPVFIAFVGYNTVNGFWGSGPGDVISTHDLSLWISNLENATGTDDLTLVFDAGLGGLLTERLGACLACSGRVVVASSGTGQHAFASNTSLRFSETFWTSLAQNMSVARAWDLSQRAIQITGLSQTAQMSETQALSPTRGLALLPPASPPVIDFVSTIPLSYGEMQLLTQVRDDVKVNAVIAEVFPPGYTGPSWMSGTNGTAASVWPQLNIVTTTLKLSGASSYSGKVQGITMPGCYRIVIQARDDSGYVGLPQAAQVCVEREVHLPIVMK